MALFFERGEGKGLVLHRKTTPGPLCKSDLHVNALWQATWLSSWSGGRGVDDRLVLHRWHMLGPLWRVGLKSCDRQAFQWLSSWSEGRGGGI